MGRYSSTIFSGVNTWTEMCSHAAHGTVLR
jgi:hypothetical protein